MNEYITPAAVRGFYLAVLSGLGTGIVAWQAAGVEAGVAAGISAFVLAQGGRIVEGGYDARKRGTGGG